MDNEALIAALAKMHDDIEALLAPVRGEDAEYTKPSVEVEIMFLDSWKKLATRAANRIEGVA